MRRRALAALAAGALLLFLLRHPIELRLLRHGSAPPSWQAMERLRRA